MTQKEGQTKWGWSLAERIFDLFCSLKLAVVVILTLVFGLAAATILESLYDTPTAQYYVYQAFWFELTLAVLGLNIFCVAMSRLPWKPRHIPFLLAHLGILLLLLGSWVTQRMGLDGTLRVTEGESESAVELDQASLMVLDQDRIYSMPIRWQPPGVSFQPLSTQSKKFPIPLVVDRFISHADPEVSFLPRPQEEPPQAQAALKVRVTGGPMRISQEFWLWEGSAQWQRIQAGPARLSLFREGSSVLSHKDREAPGPWLIFEIQKGGLSYLAKSSEGKLARGWLPKKGGLVGQKIHPGWKGDVTLSVEQWIEDAKIQVDYQPSAVQYGAQASPPAIHVVGSQGESVWLGLGERAVIHLGDREMSLGYFPRRVILPFSLKLNRFEVEHDPGSDRPASFSSQVTALGRGQEKSALISMNEPLEWAGYTLYQASYEDALPRPTTSIFSVNQDPGRGLKYWGSLLIVLGSILLFVAKTRKSKTSATRTAVTEPIPSSSESLAPS